MGSPCISVSWSSRFLFPCCPQVLRADTFWTELTNITLYTIKSPQLQHSYLLDSNFVSVRFPTKAHLRIWLSIRSVDVRNVAVRHRFPMNSLQTISAEVLLEEYTEPPRRINSLPPLKMWNICWRFDTPKSIVISWGQQSACTYFSLIRSWPHSSRSRLRF